MGNAPTKTKEQQDYERSLLKYSNIVQEYPDEGEQMYEDFEVVAPFGGCRK